MFKFKKYSCLGIISVVFIVFIQFCQAGQQQKPIRSGIYADYNVLLVSFDALQANHVSCYGYFRNTTPNIDRFAQRGFLFKNAVSQSSWTIPSTMSWFTSLYPSEHRCINQYAIYTKNEQVLTDLKKLSPDVITLAEILKKNGYLTAGFTGDTGVGGHFGFNSGFDEYFEGPKFGGMDKSVPEALPWLKKNYKKKFFIFLHGYDCHGQYEPSGGYTRKFVDFNYKGLLKGGREEHVRLREEGLRMNSLKLDNNDVRFLRSLYDEKINDADIRFGEFVKELEKLGILDKTIIILVSDHGTEFYEHRRIGHGFSLYDELIHVPLIFRLPDRTGEKIIEDQVRSIDIMPTLLDLIGINSSKKAYAQMRGKSLLPLMNGKHMELDAFSETDYLFRTFKRSIRTADGWKFIYTMETGEKELYNLREDPKELNNLAKREKRIAYELEQRLFEWLGTMGQDESYYQTLIREVLKIKEYY